MTEQWVLLWSQSQNALHIEPLERMLSSNRDAYKEDRRSDYVPLYIGERSHVDAASAYCHGTLAEREQRPRAHLQEAA